MSAINATDLITSIESYSINKIKDFSLQELAHFAGVELNTSTDLTALCTLINHSTFQTVMSNKKFLSLSIIKHYHDIDTHYFAFEVLDYAQCPCCEDVFPIYNAIFVKDDDYGFTEILGIDYNIVDSEYYNTVSDIIPLLENRTSF